MNRRIPQSFIDKLLSAVDIYDVVNTRISTIKTGSSASANCPFHEDNSSSLTLDLNKQKYSCDTCDIEGSAIGFLMYFDNVHFMDSLVELSELSGIPIDEYISKDVIDKPTESSLNLLCSAAEYFHQSLLESTEPLNYLLNRGLSHSTIEKYKLGYSPSGRDYLSVAFPNNDSALSRVGLYGRNPDKTYFPRFRDRVMFPVTNASLRIVGFGARSLTNNTPKYLNSPASKYFDKRSLFFSSIDSASDCSNDECLIVEGYMDVLKLSQHGHNNVFSPMGTSITQEHIDCLLNKYRTVVFCMDGDAAGFRSALRSVPLFQSKLLECEQVRYVSLPDGHDPDSFICSSNYAEFVDYLGNSVDVVSFVIDKLTHDRPLIGVGDMASLSVDVRKYLGTFASDSIRLNASEQLSELLNINTAEYFNF